MDIPSTLPTLDDEEAQPFFRACIFILPSLQAAQGTSNPLLALKVALQGAFHKFLQDPVPTGAEGYIFNRAPPSFQVVPAPSATLPSHLVVECSTDNATEDAHLLIHFLRLQQRTLLSQCAVQVHTEDGELLLIEAADALPEWIDPSNADGRVWMVREHVAVIPPDVDRGVAGAQGDCGPISDYHTALDILANPSNAQVIVSQPITDAAFAPLTSYPDTTWIETVQHRTTVYLPTNALSAALVSDTQLISRASRAFLGREGTEVRVASRMARFLSGINTTTSSTPRLTPIPIPRRVYAQLLSQRFMPPKVFPTPYRDRVAAFWEAIDALASPDNTSPSTESLHDGRRWDLGCKLAVGLEIAYWNDKERLKSQQRKGRSVREVDQSPADLRSSPEYPQFIDRLTSLGYFHGELTGSAKWQALEREALASWQQTDAHAEDSDSTEDFDWVARIDADADAVSVPTIDPQDKSRISLLELDDSWLWDVDGQGQALGDIAADTDKQAEQEATQRLSDFSKRVESFIAGKGDVEGALVEGDDSSGGESDDEEDGDDSDGVAREEARKQLAAMQPAEREEKMKSLVSGLEGATGTDTWGRGTEAQVDMELDEHLLSELRTGGDGEATTTSDQPDPTQPPSTRPLSPDAMRAEMSTYRTRSTKGPTQSSSYFTPQQFDGAESWQLDSEDDSDEERESKEVRRERAKLLDLSESEDEDDDDDGADEEMIRARDEAEEMDEFLEFARKELGLSEGQLKDVLEERKEGGRWVPGEREKGKAAAAKAQSVNETATALADSTFGKGFAKGFLGRQKSGLKQTAPSRSPSTASPPKKKKVSFTEKDKQTGTTTASPPPPSTRNESLSTFDSLMAALDTRLDEHRASRGLPPLNREEYYNSDIRGEDWSLRREGGASLGSVMREKAQESEQPAAPSTADAPSTTTTAMDLDADEHAPLQATDPALLARLQQQDHPSALRDLIHGEMDRKYGKGAGKFAEGRGDPVGIEDAGESDRASELASRLAGSSRTATAAPRIQEIVADQRTPKIQEITEDSQPPRQTYGPDSDPPPMSYADSDDDEYDVEISGPGDGEYDPMDAEDMNEGEGASASTTRGQTHAQTHTLPQMLDDELHNAEDRDDEDLPTIVNESEIISNLMESWRAQGADPGPVGLMFGGGRASERR